MSVKSSHVLGHPPEQFRIIDTRNADLTLDSNYADPNRLAHTFWILQTCLLRLFLLLERLRQRRKLTVDVLEEEPLLNHFGHVNFIAQAAEHRDGTNCRDDNRSPKLDKVPSKVHQTAKNDLNTPKPSNRKFLTLLRITFGGLGSIRLKAIRNRQAASSTLALGSRICWSNRSDLRGRELRRFSKCAVEMITFTIFATF